MAARAPTPIEPLERLSAALVERGAPPVELWIKRDDLTGFALGGNKVRKLEFSFAAALSAGADTVLTCGGFDSNHCRATAFLARRHGLVPHLLLRTSDGKPVASWQGNTLLGAIAGAEITWVTPDEYRSGITLLESHAERLGAQGRTVAVIPEGASDARGALGFVAASEELAEQELECGFSFDAVLHAVGSGGTSAGLQAGRDALARPWNVLGVPVCDDGAYFRSKVRTIRQDLTEEFGLPAEGTAPGDRYLDGFAGRGYGLSDRTELEFYAWIARTEGILLDPCYTGKAFRALVDAVERGEFAAGSRILFWHTGGAFANFSAQGEWQEALGL